jgi:hypothetical protein
MKPQSKSFDRLSKARKMLANLNAEQKEMLLQNAVVMTVEGRRLSPDNTMLVYLQKNDATVVAGFNQWKKAGRVVAKGASGISIWVPIGTSKEGATDTDDTRFIAGTVFDITQTEVIPQTEEVEAQA